MNHNGNGKPKDDDEPPWNLEAETGLIASLYALPGAADYQEVASLTPGDFGLPEHRILYRHLVAARLAGQSPEVLPARLIAANEYDIPGVRDALTATATARISGADARWFADQIRETAVRRRQWEFCREYRRLVRDRMPVEDIDAFAELFGESRKAVTTTDAFTTVDKMLETYTDLRPYVINPVVRVSETINIVAPSKRGKSWFVLVLAFCLATGKRWLDSFACRPGRVLLIDNELHNETLAYRIRKVAEELGLQRREYGSNLVVKTVRGQNMDIHGLEKYLSQFKPGDFSTIVLDALYRFYPKGFNENENADMTWLYNLLDSIADRLQCVIICIIHSSKGSQADKSVVDVGSGAGAMARATDSHMVLRQHEEPNAVVLEMAPRSSPPLEPICLRFKWPLWIRADDLDPAALHRPGKRTKTADKAETEWTADIFASTFGTTEPQLKAALIEAACAAGIKSRKASELIVRAAATGKLHKWPTDDKREFSYATVPAPVVTLPKAAKSQGKRRNRKAG